MAAAVTHPTPAAPPRAAGPGPGIFFTFLKDGVLVPARNHGLFLPLVALRAARSMAFYLAKTLGYRVLVAALDLQAYGDAVDGDLFLDRLAKFLAGRRCLPCVGAACAYLAAHLALGLAIKVATVSAAVASCSGAEGRSSSTLASLLGDMLRRGGNLRGPIATVVFGDVVPWAAAGAMMLPLPAAAQGPYPDLAVIAMLFAGFIASLFWFLFYVLYFDVACAVAVVASVAEPGVRGAGAVGRARRLMRGTKKLAQAALYALVAQALYNALWRMHALAEPRLPRSIVTATFRLDGVIVYLLLGAWEVVCTAAVTAYYFDCRRTEEEKAGHRE